MSESKPRKHYAAQEKIAILRRHLVENVPVSDLCEQHQLQPTVFYRWQQELFENGAVALERKNRNLNGAEQRKIAALEAKLIRKNEVLSGLMEEHVKLKKTIGVG